MTNKEQPTRVKELDALRGIAALLVVFFHFTMYRPQANYGFKLGTTGIDLFFIISGFVILMSLTKIKSSADYAINRISRLYPAYWAAVTFTFIMILLSPYLEVFFAQPASLDEYLGNMTMFQFYLQIPNLDGPYWTLIIEINFYIGMFLLFHFKKLPFINAIGITLSLLSVIMTSFFYDLFVVKWVFTRIPLLQYVPLFFAGTVFYKVYSKKNKLTENYLILAICLICQLLLFKHSGRSHRFISHGEYAMMLILYFSLFTLFVNGKLQFIVTRVTMFFGKISYPLFLVHQYVSISIIIPFLTNELHLNFWIASFCITLPIATLLATCITYYIEVPGGLIMKDKLRALRSWSMRILSTN